MNSCTDCSALVIAWAFLNWVLVLWNVEFRLFAFWTWDTYRAQHPDKLALSVLLFGLVTYFCLESLQLDRPSKA